MAQKDINKTKYYKDKYYLTYNQIIKEYDVFILSEDEYNNLPQDKQKEVRYMILIKKSKANPPEPKGPPAWALAMEERIIALINQKIDEVKQYVDNKISNLVQKNNLKQ